LFNGSGSSSPGIDIPRRALQKDTGRPEFFIYPPYCSSWPVARYSIHKRIDRYRVTGKVKEVAHVFPRLISKRDKRHCPVHGTKGTGSAENRGIPVIVAVIEIIWHMIFPDSLPDRTRTTVAQVFRYVGPADPHR